MSKYFWCRLCFARFIRFRLFLATLSLLPASRGTSPDPQRRYRDYSILRFQYRECSATQGPTKHSRLPAILLLTAVAGCDSGGDSVGLPVVSLSSSSVAFVTTGPDDPVPQSQTVSGEFNVNAVYMAAVLEGDAVERITHTLSGKAITIAIHPKSPAELGAGLHTSRIAVFGQACADAGCSRLASGPAASIDVKYVIPQIVTTVSPYVAMESEPGNVIVRGSGFTQFDVSGVSFGGFPASAYSVVSDTQIEATHPALAAGRYALQLQVEGAPIQPRSGAELVVVAPEAFTAATVAYPTPNPTVTRILYDPERSALLLVTSQNGGELLRYRYAGNAWSAADVLPIDALNDIAMMVDGRSIFAVTDSSVVPIDADTLSTDSPLYPTLDSGTTLAGIAFGNDGRALITTSTDSTASSPFYLYAPAAAGFTASSTTLLNALPRESGNGALIVVTQQDTSAATTPSLYHYSASGDALTAVSTLNRNGIAQVVDRLTTRIALNGLVVYDSSYNLIGSLPATTLAVVFSPDGSRLYAYDSTAAAILVYDTATTTGTTLNQIAVPLAVTGDPGETPQIAISLAGDTVFLAGLDHLSIIPVLQ